MPKSPAAAAVALIAAFAIGFVVSRSTGEATAAGTDPAVDIPAVALKSWYPPVQGFENDGEPLDDERFDALMASLDEAMTADETVADIGRSIEPAVQGFFRRIAIPELSEDQSLRANHYLTGLAERHPEQEDLINRQVSMLGMYTRAYPVMPAFMTAVRSVAYADGLYPPDGIFDDTWIDRMLAGLDAMLELPETVNDFEREAASLLRGFTQRLQHGRISDEQTDRVLAHLDAFAEKHPELAEVVEDRRRYIEYLVPGRVAKSVVGKDLDGVEFSLEEYRGNIVVLVFSGEWCGPCRGEYPYHRFAMEQYKDEPIVFLGVNSDADPEVILASKARGEAPDYRTWWDGHSQPDAEIVATEGPIATAWEVRAWPSVYVLDQEGVILHINKRSGELIAALDDLVLDIRRARFDAERAAEVEAAAAETETEDGTG
ncbi:MAG: TlpA disulfide reductase family protein [Gemmatimonadota bacterium]|nr:TlpA disulfide reductase family protein [Gemmatimonadota bacterium]MDE2984336.1 TlpA disulfide reductase family protein [Gemmatimonadota bacterium]